MTFNEYKEHINCYKKAGLLQFQNLFKRYKDIKINKENLHWGEEIEYHLYSFREEENLVLISADCSGLLEKYNELTEGGEKFDFKMLPEFGNWMIEATPLIPYGAYDKAENLLCCVQSIKLRREQLEKILKTFTKEKEGAEHLDKGQDNLWLVSTGSVPNMGSKGNVTSFDMTEKNKYDEAYTLEHLEDANPNIQSKYVPEFAANPHPRMLGVAKSIYERRARKVNITLPLFHDKKTNMEEVNEDQPYPGRVWMDAMHFGMGCSSLQLTYESQTMDHARYLYDMLLPFTPLMSAMSASTPIHKSRLVDYDLRFAVIEQAVDDRTEAELEANNPAKSRYSPANLYLSNHEFVQDKHNDGQQLSVNSEHVDFLMNEVKCDARLTNHIASIFVRDPIPSFSIELKNTPCQFDNSYEEQQVMDEVHEMVGMCPVSAEET